jgi:photosystem II stability/assembly factor-like uncharacterized protein
MTQQELDNEIDQFLTRVGNDRLSAADIRYICHQIVAFAASGQAASELIPEWTALLTFNTDGSGDGRYCKHPDVNGRVRIWETKTDGNINNPPPTDPEVDENSNWFELSPANGSGIKEWEPGVYGDGLTIVAHNHSVLGYGFAWLLEPVRPFNSVNVEYEITIGKWAWMSVDKFLNQYVRLSDNANITWNLANKKISTASVVTVLNAINLTIEGLLSGTMHSLFIRKMDADDLVITPLFNGLPVFKVNDSVSETTITLSGPAGKVFKLDFARLEAVQGATLLGETGGDSNTRLHAIDENTFIAVMSRYVKKSIDAGANWSIEHDSGEATDLFNSLSFAGQYGLAAAGNTINSGALVRSSDHGDSWTLTQLVSEDDEIHVLRIDVNVGYYIRKHGLGTSHQYKIYKSTDGCAAFVEIHEWSSNAPKSICKGSSNNVIYVGRTVGKVSKTIDAGASFTDVNILGVSFDVTTIKFLTDTLGLAAGANASLYKTLNGGGSWSQLPIPSSIGNITDAAFIDSNRFVVTGSGGVAYTIDGGATFLMTNTINDPKSISIVDEDNIFILNSLGDVYKFTIPSDDDFIFVVNTNEGGGSAKSISKVYADIASLLADQANQEEDFLYLVTDASADATVDAGWAVYQKLAATTGAIGDYRKLTEQESLDVIFSVPDANETTAGKSEEATDGETQAGTAVGGTGSRLFVNPAKLAAWWTWIKTQAQTFAAQITFTLSPIVSSATVDTFTKFGASKELVSKTVIEVLDDLGINVIRETVNISAGSLGLNMNGKKIKKFLLGATASSDFSVVMSNTGSAEGWSLLLNVTGVVAITFEAPFRMGDHEVSNSRWVSATHILTLTGTTDTPFELSAEFDGTIWRLRASIKYV